MLLSSALHCVKAVEQSPETAAAFGFAQTARFRLDRSFDRCGRRQRDGVPPAQAKPRISASRMALCMCILFSD